MNVSNNIFQFMYSRSKNTKQPYLFQYKLSYRNEIGINHHELLSTSVWCFKIFLSGASTWGDIHIYTCIYIYICIHMYAYVYVYIYALKTLHSQSIWIPKKDHEPLNCDQSWVLLYFRCPNGNRACWIVHSLIVYKFKQIF